VVELYASPACDPSGYGEGRTQIEAQLMTTDATGHAETQMSFAPQAAGTAITATASGAGQQRTSEFSACTIVGGAPAPAQSPPPVTTATPPPPPSPSAPVATSSAQATPAPVPPPVAGEQVDVAPVSGVVLVKRKGQKTATPLRAGEQIPVGSLVDATDGRVRLTAAAGGGATQTADFYGGAFTIAQDKGAKPVTELRLAAPKKACAARAAISRAGGKKKRKRSKKLVQEVWGDGAGSFRTRGAYGSAAIRGTKWLTRDRCDGTFFQAAQGTVSIRDFGRRKTVLLRAPHTYLAKARS
jgi:hypothetical protein